jgi:hypothetical protein
LVASHEKSRLAPASCSSLHHAAATLTSTPATASPTDALDSPLVSPGVRETVDILALQSTKYGGGGSVAVASPMAQPNAEPVEEYEYVHTRTALPLASKTLDS